LCRGAALDGLMTGGVVPSLAANQKPLYVQMRSLGGPMLAPQINADGRGQARQQIPRSPRSL